MPIFTIIGTFWLILFPRRSLREVTVQQSRRHRGQQKQGRRNNPGPEKPMDRRQGGNGVVHGTGLPRRRDDGLVFRSGNHARRWKASLGHKLSERKAPDPRPSFPRKRGRHFAAPAPVDFSSGGVGFPYSEGTASTSTVRRRPVKAGTPPPPSSLYVYPPDHLLNGRVTHGETHLAQLHKPPWLVFAAAPLRGMFTSAQVLHLHALT